MDHIFLQVVEISSHGRYMYETGRNKSSNFEYDTSTSSAPLEAAYQRIRELESTQSQLQEKIRELRNNIQSSDEWKLQTEENDAPHDRANNRVRGFEPINYH